jgi:hypothetical protein
LTQLTFSLKIDLISLLGVFVKKILLVLSLLSIDVLAFRPENSSNELTQFTSQLQGVEASYQSSELLSSLKLLHNIPEKSAGYQERIYSFIGKKSNKNVQLEIVNLLGTANPIQKNPKGLVCHKACWRQCQFWATHLDLPETKKKFNGHISKLSSKLERSRTFFKIDVLNDLDIRLKDSMITDLQHKAFKTELNNLLNETSELKREQQFIVLELNYIQKQIYLDSVEMDRDLDFMKVMRTEVDSLAAPSVAKARKACKSTRDKVQDPSRLFKVSSN